MENFGEDCGKVVESLGKKFRKDKNFEDRLGLAVQAGGGFSGIDHGLISLMRSPITLYPSFAVLVHLSIEFAQSRLELNPIHHRFCWKESDFFDRISRRINHLRDLPSLIQTLANFRIMEGKDNISKL